MMESGFDINEPLSFKGNFVDKEESAITAKPIRNDEIFILDVSLLQISNKKCQTYVTGIPDDIDLHKVLKAWKKVCYLITHNRYIIAMAPSK